METNQNEAEAGKRKIFISIIVALLLIVSVTLYFVFSGNEENTNLTAQKNALNISFKNLSDTLDVRKTEIDQIAYQNVQLDSVVVASQVVIADKKRQIASLLSKAKITKADLEEAEKMIARYGASISDLQKKVVELSAQNELLTRQNQQLSGDLDSERKTTTGLNEQNKELSRRVEVGSLLQLAKVDVEGVKQKPNGKETVVKNAKSTESIRISFETGNNKVLANGPLSLYVRVINPKGETISVANQGSGNLQLAESNSQMQYSKKADIDWNQSNKKVVVYWKQNISAVGMYKVEIYQSGYLIGKGEVKLS